jgi:hypothetical protein
MHPFKVPSFTTGSDIMQQSEQDGEHLCIHCQHYRELTLRQAMQIAHMRRQAADSIKLMNEVVEVRSKVKPLLYKLLRDESFLAE